jgi:ribosome modulation factor
MPEIALNPPPFNPHGEKGELGRLEAQNERRNAGASKKNRPYKTPDPRDSLFPGWRSGACVARFRVRRSGAASRVVCVSGLGAAALTSGAPGAVGVVIDALPEEDGTGAVEFVHPPFWLPKSKSFPLLRGSQRRDALAL